MSEYIGGPLDGATVPPKACVSDIVIAESKDRVCVYARCESGHYHFRGFFRTEPEALQALGLTREDEIGHGEGEIE